MFVFIVFDCWRTEQVVHSVHSKFGFAVDVALSIGKSTQYNWREIHEFKVEPPEAPTWTNEMKEKS